VFLEPKELRVNKDRMGREENKERKDHQGQVVQKEEREPLVTLDVQGWMGNL
jgi:hypothetical protein